MNWPREGAYLALANGEDLSPDGPQELLCDIQRLLGESELTSQPSGSVAALELECDVPDSETSTTVFVGVTLPEAIPSLDALVGREAVSLLFAYPGPPEVDLGFNARIFGLRDEIGPLLLSNSITCEGPFIDEGVECGFLLSPFMTASSWSDPVSEPKLATVGCGTRAWEYNEAPSPGVYEMSRLAVRFETESGGVDALDQDVTALDIAGQTYDFFAIEAVGEVEDPAVVFGTNSYTGSARFLLTRRVR